MRGLSKESRLLNPDFRDILCVSLEEGVELPDFSVNSLSKSGLPTNPPRWFEFLAKQALFGEVFAPACIRVGVERRNPFVTWRILWVSAHVS
jgi:hypothetical protein